MLGVDAIEPQIMRLPLDQYWIISFAAHGLEASAAGTKPRLVRTVPEKRLPPTMQGGSNEIAAPQN